MFVCFKRIRNKKGVVISPAPCTRTKWGISAEVTQSLHFPQRGSYITLHRGDGDSVLHQAPSFETWLSSHNFLGQESLLLVSLHPCVTWYQKILLRGGGNPVIDMHHIQGRRGEGLAPAIWAKVAWVWLCLYWLSSYHDILELTSSVLNSYPRG